MHDNGQQIASAALELTKNGIEFLFGRLQDYLDLKSIQENKEFIERMLQKGGDVFMVTNISTVDMDKFREESGFNYLQGKDDSGRSIFFLPKDSFETFSEWCTKNHITPVVEDHEFTTEDAFESAVNQSEDQKREEAFHDFNVHCETCEKYNQTVDKLNVIAKANNQPEAEYRDFYFATDIDDKFVSVVAVDGNNFVKYSIDNNLDINDISQGTYQTISREEAFEIYMKSIDSNYALGHFTHDNIVKLLRKDEIDYKYEKEPFTYKKEEQEVSQNNQENQNNQEKDTTKEQNEDSQDINNPTKQSEQPEQATNTKNQEDDDFEHDRNDQYNYTDNLNDDDDIDEAENARKWAEYEEQKAKESQDTEVLDDEPETNKKKNKNSEEEKRRKEENDRLNKAKEDQKKREEQKLYEESKREESQRFEQEKKADEQRLEQIKQDDAKRLEQTKNKESENIVQTVVASEAIKSSEIKQAEQSYQESKVQTETKSVESLKAEEAKSAEAEKIVQRLEREAYQREISEAQIKLNDDRIPELKKYEDSIRSESIEKEHGPDSYATIAGNNPNDNPKTVSSNRDYHNAAMDVHEANRTRESHVVENTKAIMNTQEWRDGCVGDGFKNLSKYDSMYASAFGYGAVKDSYERHAVVFRTAAMNGNYSELSSFMKAKGYNCDFRDPDALKQNLASVKAVLRAEGIHDANAFRHLSNERFAALFGISSMAQINTLKSQMETALTLGDRAARVDRMSSRRLGNFFVKIVDDKVGDEVVHQGYKNIKSKVDTVNMGRKVIHKLQDFRHQLRAKSLARFRRNHGTGGPRYDRMNRRYQRSSYRYDIRNKNKLSAESKQYVREVRARRNARIDKRAERLNKRRAGAGDRYKQRLTDRKKAKARREAGRRLRKDRRSKRFAPVKNFFGGIANRIGRVFKVFTAPFNVVYIIEDFIKQLVLALLKKLSTFLLPYIGWFLLYYTLFAALVSAIVVILSYISSFDINQWEVNNVYDTPMGITYKNVVSLEKQWVKDLKKTGSQNKSFEIFFDDNTSTELNTLASKNTLVTVKDDYIVYDALGLGIDEYKHEIKKVDGGCNIKYININNPGYFSNIKDILSMTSVYFGLDMEEYSEEDRDKWYEKCKDWLDSAVNFCNNLNHKLSNVVENIFNWDAPSATLHDFKTSAIYDSYALSLFSQTHDVEFHIHSATSLPTCKDTTDFVNNEGFISVCTQADMGGCAEIKVYIDNDGKYYIKNGETKITEAATGQSLGELIYVMTDERCHVMTDSQKQYSDCWDVKYKTVVVEKDSIYTEVKNTQDSQSKAESDCKAFEGEENVVNTYISYNGREWSVHVTYKVTDEFKESVPDGYTHNCQGHTGRYCGGHVMIEATGLIHSIPAEMLEDNADLSKDINRIKPTGVTIIGDDGEIKMDEMSNYDSANIFEIDSNIKHRIQPGSWESWTSDNVSIAIMRYDQDWKELYAIDFGDSELGNVGFSSVEADETLRAIEERYGQPLDDTRKARLKMALSYVGKIGYSLNGHNTLFPENGGTVVHQTDCSGYASNVWFNELGNKIRTCAGFYSDYINSGYMQKWDDNIKPGDIFISKGTDDMWGYNEEKKKGDDHALIYAGTDINGQVWVLECTSDPSGLNGVRYGVKGRNRSYFTNSYYIDMSQLY